MKNKPKELIDALDKAVLDSDYPIELVNEYLREFGLDPEEVAREGREFVNKLIEKYKEKVK